MVTSTLTGVGHTSVAPSGGEGSAMWQAKRGGRSYAGLSEWRPHLKLEGGDLINDLPVNCFLGLQANDQLVCGHIGERRNCARNRVELDAHLGLPIGHGFARLENERDTIPARAMYVQDRGGERLCRAVHILDRRILQVSLVVAAARILPDDQVIQSESLDRLKDFEFLGANMLSSKREWLLHRNERKYLQQVVLHHVPDDAVLVEVTTTSVSAKILFEYDLDSFDMLPIPDGLEAYIGETARRELYALSCCRCAA